MITKDKYGNSEDDVTKLPANPRQVQDDPIGRYLKAPGYLQNHRIKGIRFDRYYFAERLAMDLFKKNGPEVDREIQLKKKLVRNEKIKYIPVANGTELTLKELKNILKGE